MTDIQQTKILHFFNVLDHDGNGILEQEDFELVSDAICDIRDLASNSTERLNLGIKAHGIFVQVLKDLQKDTAVVRREEWLKFFERQILSRSEDYISSVSAYLFSILSQLNRSHSLIQNLLDTDLPTRGHQCNRPSAKLQETQVEHSY